jgi:NAD(P)H-dependent flavin oxidoreductase YrpB (nitropropane dioxygenase family)
MIETRFTQLVGATAPIQVASMPGVSTVELVAAVANAVRVGCSDGDVLAGVPRRRARAHREGDLGRVRRELPDAVPRSGVRRESRRAARGSSSSSTAIASARSSTRRTRSARS